MLETWPSTWKLFWHEKRKMCSPAEINVFYCLSFPFPSIRIPFLSFICFLFCSSLLFLPLKNRIKILKLPASYQQLKLNFIMSDVICIHVTCWFWPSVHHSEYLLHSMYLEVGKKKVVNERLKFVERFYTIQYLLQLAWFIH